MDIRFARQRVVKVDIGQSFISGLLTASLEILSVLSKDLRSDKIRARRSGENVYIIELIYNVLTNARTYQNGRDDRFIIFLRRV